MSKIIADDLEGVIFRIMYMSDRLRNLWSINSHDEKMFMRCFSFLTLQAAQGLKLLGDNPENERELLANMVAILHELDIEM